MYKRQIINYTDLTFQSIGIIEIYSDVKFQILQILGAKSAKKNVGFLTLFGVKKCKWSGVAGKKRGGVFVLISGL